MIIFTFLDLISRVMIGYDRNSIYASILKYFPVAIWHRMDFRGKSGIWDLGLALCVERALSQDGKPTGREQTDL